MPRIKVITDGSIDVPAQEVEQYDIMIVPPIVHIDGRDYRSGVDIQPEEFFVKQAEAKAMPTTSQPSPGEFVEAFQEALRTHDEILYVGISSALSGTLNSARQATTEFPDAQITLVDTHTLSAAGGMQVIAAARVLDAGGSLDEAVAATRRTHEDTTLLFALKDLTYLIKGGRIGRAAGAVGQLLSICPILTVDPEDGALAPLTRVRTFKKTFNTLISRAEMLVGEGGAARFVVLRGTLGDEADRMQEVLREKFDVRWMREVVPAPTLLAHTGPNAVGIVVSKGDW